MKLRDFHMSTALLVVGLALAAGFVGAVFVVLFGLFNVSARDGHWPGVSWVLHTTFENSAALRAPPDDIVPENLDTPGMIALGAGHFMNGCAICHGAPGVPRGATVRQMLPVPPTLDDVSEKFEATELYWIVYNGIKMSGMPAWPAERSDDVWPVVAFLRALPGIDADGYAHLTDTTKGACAMCHGPDGASTNPQVPRLDILSEDYVAHSLAAYRSGRRDSGIMYEAAGHLDETAVQRIARAYGTEQPAGATESGTNGEAFEAGRRLAYADDKSHSVPACRACHGPWPEPLNERFPSLAGQHAPYLEQQLRLWRDGNRGGGRAAELMFRAARDLTDEQIEMLAAYYAGLAPAKLNAVAE